MVTNTIIIFNAIKLLHVSGFLLCMSYLMLITNLGT